MMRCIQISDLHVGRIIKQKNTLEVARSLVDHLNSLKYPIDFVINTGDIANLEEPEAYQEVAKIFKDLKYPIYFLSGNHDSPNLVRGLITQPVNYLAADRAFYFFQTGLHTNLVLDSYPKIPHSPKGFLPESDFALIEQVLQEAELVNIFGHFPPVKLDSIWLNDKMLIENGDKLHELLVRYKSKVSGYFFGHVHSEICVHKDGIFYASCRSPSFDFSSNPDVINLSGLDDPIVSFRAPICYNVLAFDGTAVILKHVSLAN
jgi:Icc protein